ncbi:MAG: hypothetical protein AAB425_04485, partial [Bdellovibrionota bacterium]
MRRRLKQLSESARVELRWERIRNFVWFAVGFGLIWNYNAARDRWFPHVEDQSKVDPASRYALKKAEIANALSLEKVADRLPERLRMKVRDGFRDVQLEYSLDPELQEEMDDLIASYAPDY